jgi:hypothetical protein
VNQNEIITLMLQPAVRECQLHKRRIDYALERLKGRFPLSGGDWQNLDDETVADIDQLLFRYSKLQDAVGQRLFPAILLLGGEFIDEETFIDKLNRLEKLGAIPSAEQWLQLRQIRNRMTHEYPDAPERNAQNVNQVVDSLTTLNTHLAAAEDFATRLSSRMVR